MKVTVGLKNPPSGGNYWQLILFNEVWGDSIKVGMHIPVDQPMTLLLPAGWTSPLYIDIIIYELNVSPYNIVYRVQSAYGSDWPNYKPLFIDELGVYEYNVATEQLESIAPELTLIEITAPDSAEEGSLVSMSTKVKNISAYNLLFRVELYAVRDISAVPDPEERIGSVEVAIGSGRTQTISGKFTMPAWDTIVLIMVYRFIEYWDYDNLATKVVSVEEAPVPEYKGSIARKELEYDETRSIIPIY